MKHSMGRLGKQHVEGKCRKWLLMMVSAWLGRSPQAILKCEVISKHRGCATHQRGAAGSCSCCCSGASCSTGW
jgi:hypothetical protein